MDDRGYKYKVTFITPLDEGDDVLGYVNSDHRLVFKGYCGPDKTDDVNIHDNYRYISSHIIGSTVLLMRQYKKDIPVLPLHFKYAVLEIEDAVDYDLLVRLQFCPYNGRIVDSTVYGSSRNGDIRDVFEERMVLDNISLSEETYGRELATSQFKSGDDNLYTPKDRFIFLANNMYKSMFENIYCETDIRCCVNGEEKILSVYHKVEVESRKGKVYSENEWSLIYKYGRLYIDVLRAVVAVIIDIGNELNPYLSDIELETRAYACNDDNPNDTYVLVGSKSNTWQVSNVNIFDRGCTSDDEQMGIQIFIDTKGYIRDSLNVHVEDKISGFIDLNTKQIYRKLFGANSKSVII